MIDIKEMVGGVDVDGMRRKLKEAKLEHESRERTKEEGLVKLEKLLMAMLSNTQEDGRSYLSTFLSTMYDWATNKGALQKHLESSNLRNSIDPNWIKAAKHLTNETGEAELMLHQLFMTALTLIYRKDRNLCWEVNEAYLKSKGVFPGQGNADEHLETTKKACLDKQGCVMAATFNETSSFSEGFVEHLDGLDEALGKLAELLSLKPKAPNYDS